MSSADLYRNKYLVFEDISRPHLYALSCGCICYWNRGLFRYISISDLDWSHIIDDNYQAFWMQSNQDAKYKFNQHIAYAHPDNEYVNRFQYY